MGYTDILVLQAITGANDKQKFIKDHAGDENFRNFLYYALNPLLSYNLSEATLRKEDTSVPNTGYRPFKDIFECCEYLSRLRGLDDATVRQIKMFLYATPEDARELYIKLLSKTLRLGVTAKTVNKVIPNLIPEWEIQQAYPIEKYPIKKGTYFWLSQKLNGTRATYYNGKLVARSGSAYTGLDHITEELKWTEGRGIVLDGELTLKDEFREGLSDNEAFRKATGIINSDESVNKTMICFTVFDVIPVSDFESSKPSVNYSARRGLLDNLSELLPKDGSVNILPCLYHGTDLSKIDELLDQMVSEDKEGLMANLDVPYRRTRHNGILKIKRFYTMDLPIVRVEAGTGRLDGTLGAFVLQYENNEVKVGSGFTDEQRAEYWANPEALIGTLCEVKYKEISSDKKTGLKSLQFPVFVRLRDDKTEVSYG